MSWKVTWFGAALSLAMIGSAVADEVELRASHQFPGGKGDVRDEMVMIIKREIEAAGVGLSMRVYPGASLFKPDQQWDALTRGQLDVSAFPLDYASGRHPQFSATLMPGLVKNHDHAKRLNDSPFMAEIKKIIDEAGAMVLADAWLAGGFVGTDFCVQKPESVAGKTFRAAGPGFERMLAGAGASISSMPSSELYTGLQTGVLDGANTSSASLVSYRIYEQVKCLTPPGDHALWFMYEPILVSKASFEELTPEQQEVLLAASEKAEEFFFDAAKKIDDDMVKTFQDAGVEVVDMSAEDYDAWLAVAKETSYKQFAEEVEGGDRLIEMALQVQ